VTFFQLLKQAQETLSPSSDAEIDAHYLACHAFQLSKQQLLARLNEKIISYTKEKNYQRLIQKRKQGMPLAYLVGHTSFLKRPYVIQPGVLIPRPETEELVLTIQNKLPTLPDSSHIWECGFGSGVICIELALFYKKSNVLAWDISQKAYKNALMNARQCHAFNLTLIPEDFLKNTNPVPPTLFVSNPPYIDRGLYHTLSEEVKKEPKAALFAGKKGMLMYQKICQFFHKRAWPKWLFFEIGFDLKQPLESLLSAYCLKEVSFLKDSQGLDRFLMIQS